MADTYYEQHHGSVESITGLSEETQPEPTVNVETSTDASQITSSNLFVATLGADLYAGTDW